MPILDEVRITELPGADPLAGPELIPLVQSGVTKSRSAQNLVLDGGLQAHLDAADPHSQYAELSGGASANFTAMPQVGGDPIVESGTNSNGEYTKFADGTLLLIFEDTSYDSSVSRRDYTPPSAFITSKLITVGSITSTGVLSLTDVKALTSISGVWSSSRGGEIRLFSDTVNAFTGIIYFSVIGRWF